MRACFDSNDRISHSLRLPRALRNGIELDLALSVDRAATERASSKEVFDHASNLGSSKKQHRLAVFLSAVSLLGRTS